MKGKDLGLINYEGWVLKLCKADNGDFVVYDQWDSIVDILDLKELCAFLEGKTNLMDSSGKSWNWLREHKEARTSLFAILKYITNQHG